jgi:hypothetical protein
MRWRIERPELFPITLIFEEIFDDKKTRKLNLPLKEPGIQVADQRKLWKRGCKCPSEAKRHNRKTGRTGLC